MRYKKWVIVLVIIFVLGLILPAVQVCRDWAYIDCNTGSRKGYRAWFFGLQTGSWYQESAIERFMRANHPEEFRQDWVSYAGTGRNVFGWAVLRGHGRPEPILSIDLKSLERYCSQASPSEVRRLYDELASGDEPRIRELIGQINQQMPTDK
jgi:hypothetical protein